MEVVPGKHLDGIKHPHVKAVRTVAHQATYCSITVNDVEKVNAQIH